MKKLVLGALVAMAFIQPMNAQERQGNGHRQMDPQKMLEFRMQRLDKELDLSENQENKIKAIFIESSVPEKAIQAVIEGAKEKGHDVEVGGELFSDAMGEGGTEEGTYLGMFRHNIDTITNALK